MRKTLCIVAVGVISLYLIVSRGQWGGEAEREARIGRLPLYTETMNIGERGVITWKVPTKEWGYKEGEANVALLLDRVPGLPEKLLPRSALALRLKVNAYAITEHGERVDRLIRNWYYRTDEPFSGDPAIWSSAGSKSVEYGLCGVWIFPFEDLHVEITITNPDPQLALGNPRLKLVGEHDYAVYEHLPFLRAIRDGGLVISLLLLAGLAIMGWNAGQGKRGGK